MKSPPLESLLSIYMIFTNNSPHCSIKHPFYPYCPFNLVYPIKFQYSTIVPLYYITIKSRVYSN